MSASAARARVAGYERVAIVHEWLTVPGGSEQVVLKLLELFPRADLFTSIYDPRPWPPAITERRVQASYLNRLPGARRAYPWLVPFMASAFASFDLGEYDLVVSSSHAFAKNVATGPHTPHVCYCHTPMRYAWEPKMMGGERINSLVRAALPLALSRLRSRDLQASRRPDEFVANSGHVAARIARYYGRDSTVIHPPVEIDRFLAIPRRRGDYYLTFGRLVPYKRVEVAVAACARLGVPLKVAGEGRAAAQLRRHAGDRTEFLGHVPDTDVAELFAGARALLFPGEEDFGIVPVEAQAAGVPVIAYGQGGIRDSVDDGRTGLLYADPTVDGLSTAIREFESLTFEEGAIRENARRFAPGRFLERFADFVAGLGDRGRAPARRA